MPSQTVRKKAPGCECDIFSYLMSVIAAQGIVGYSYVGYIG